MAYYDFDANDTPNSIIRRKANEKKNKAFCTVSFTDTCYGISADNRFLRGNKLC